MCPNCDPNSKLNFVNLKKLNSQDYELIRKLFRSIQSNRNSNPFKEPIDPKSNPKYYEIVKEPMGKFQISTTLGNDPISRCPLRNVNLGVVNPKNSNKNTLSLTD